MTRQFIVAEVGTSDKKQKPNARCKCGSGRKAKKCCEKIVALTKAQALADYDRKRKG